MERQWWHNKVAYQIYPKSFYDSNGDGIGDIPGIMEKLDYLKDLGVDILWISPVYQSPLADQGYDISDYYEIDPRFGTMKDMEALIEEAKKRQMYIHLALFCLLNQRFHILHGTKARINLIVIGDIISLVRQRRLVHRRNPENIHSQIL